MDPKPIEVESTTEARFPSTVRRSLLLLVAAAVIVVDHVSKLYVEGGLPVNGSWAPFPELAHLFRITHVTNTGAAFGLFPSSSLFFTLIAAVVAIFILYYNYRLPAGRTLLRVALGFQLGGAFGNLIDRLRLGHVTDFLDFGPVPVFNLADASIWIGVIALGIIMFQEIRMEEKPTELETAAAPKPASTAQRSLLLLIAATVIVVDHASKLYVESWLPLNRSWAPLPELAHLFRITHVTNTGAAFGLFPGGSLFFTVIATIVAIFILYYNYQLPAGQVPLRIALGLQLGGALGNLVDRLRLGHVTDFLDFGPWPVFNLADMSIVAGVVVLAVLMVQEQKELREQEERGSEEGEQERAEQRSVNAAQDGATSIRDRQMVNLQSTPPNERTT